MYLSTTSAKFIAGQGNILLSDILDQRDYKVVNVFSFFLHFVFINWT